MEKKNKPENETQKLCAFVREFNKQEEERKRVEWKAHQKEMKKQGIVLQDWQDPLYPEEEREKMLKSIEKPDTMDNGTATFFWIVAMVVSLLFKGGWILCILETIIWYKHITR